MNNWMDNFFRGDYATDPARLPELILGLMLAFLCGQLIAWIYMYTHGGLSYSRSFVNSLIVLPILVSLVMMVLSGNLVTAFGMMAVFAIVRFRNILRDTLDTTYILTAIVIGMATGTKRYPVAVIGCVLFICVMLYLWYTAFGSRHRFDLILNLHWSRPMSELNHLVQTLGRYSFKAQCASQRSSEGYEGVDLSYRLLLRNTNKVDDLLSDLRQMQGVSRLTSLKADDQSEL